MLRDRIGVKSQEFPDELEFECQYGISGGLSFSPCGNYLAIVLTSGELLLIDLDTLGIVRRAREHTSAVRLIKWSSDSTRILTAGTDWTCCWWDAHSVTVLKRIDLGGRPLDATLAGPAEAIITRVDAPALIVNCAAGTKSELDLPDKGKPVCVAAVANSAIIGTSRGYGHLVRAGEYVRTMKLANNSIRNMCANLELLLLNSNDGVLRLYDLPEDLSEGECILNHKLIDNVTHAHWHDALLNPLGHMVMASVDKEFGEIYTWDTATGEQVTTLKGPEHALFTFDIHPSSQMVAGIGGERGMVYIWTLPPDEECDHLVPDFVEVPTQDPFEENEEDFDIKEFSALENQPMRAKFSREIEIYAGTPQGLFSVKLDL